MVSAQSSVACEGSSGREGRTARLVAAFAFLVALATLPGCHSLPKPPTPILTGPDTGWTHAPIVFTAELPDQARGMSAVMMFDWGDSSSNGGYDIRFPYDHYYAKPGTYVVKCRLVHYRPHWNWQEVETRYGDWSNPCTLQILRDTLTHPDSVYAKVELGHHASWSCVLPNGSAVYVTSGDDNSVYVLDPGTNSCTQRIPVQSGPSCCVASAAGDRVYVANHGSNSISAIRTTGNSVVDTITLPAAPDRLALLPRRHAALCLARGHEPSLRCTA